MKVTRVKNWRRQWHPTPVLLPGKSHGWRSLVGCSPWGCQESNTTEQLHFDFSLSCNGEGNGNPLQCSCLENPRNGRAWWAAVYGVTQSRTRLKWLSSKQKVIALSLCGFQKSYPSGGSRSSHEKRHSIRQLSNKVDFFVISSESSVWHQMFAWGKKSENKMPVGARVLYCSQAQGSSKTDSPRNTIQFGWRLCWLC